MSASTVRGRIDSEITRRVGKWFTVREIQDKLNVNPSTLKPLIMKYAREKLLRRRSVRGTARSVEFSPAANSVSAFQTILSSKMPYRNFSETRSAATKSKKSTSKKSTKRSTSKKKTASKRRW